MASQPGKGLPPQIRPQAPTPSTAAAGDPVADAYYQFVLGRRLEDEGEVDGAIKAFRRAMELDPSSADLPTELAGLFMRQNREIEAIDTALSALKIDPANGEAHRILGSIYAERAEHDQGNAPAASGSGASNAQQAVEHLEKSLADSRLDMAAGVRLMLGRLHMRANAYDKAIVVLRQLLTDEPGLPQAVALLAQAYSAAGRSSDAIALLKDAVDEQPSFYGVLGEAYEREKRWPEAANAYSKASELNPRDTDLKTRLASSLLSAGGESNATRARDLLVSVTTANPTSGWPLYLLARAQRELEDLDGSERTARRLLTIDPSSTWGAHALAQVLEERREYARIVEALEPIAAKPRPGRESDMALILTHLGFAYLELGRSDQAVPAFEQALALDPGDVSQKTYLAQALVSAKKFDRALDAVRALRAANHSDLSLARLEADALRGLGKFDEGVAVLKPLADTPGDDSRGVQVLSEYYASDHRYAEAATVLRAAQTRFPDDMGVLFQLGAMLERQKQYDAAEKVFRQVITRNPAHAPALNYLGYTLVERNDRMQEAVAFIKRAVDIDPHNGAYLDSLGWAFLKLNQVDLAEVNLRRAAEQLPKDSVVQDHWGEVLLKQGKLADAIEAWRRSLAGDGELIDRAKIERKIRDAQAQTGRK